MLLMPSVLLLGDFRYDYGFTNLKWRDHCHKEIEACNPMLRVIIGSI